MTMKYNSISWNATAWLNSGSTIVKLKIFCSNSVEFLPVRRRLTFGNCVSGSAQCHGGHGTHWQTRPAQPSQPHLVHPSHLRHQRWWTLRGTGLALQWAEEVQEISFIPCDPCPWAAHGPRLGERPLQRSDWIKLNSGLVQSWGGVDQSVSPVCLAPKPTCWGFAVADWLVLFFVLLISMSARDYCCRGSLADRFLLTTLKRGWLECQRPGVPLPQDAHDLFVNFLCQSSFLSDTCLMPFTLLCIRTDVCCFLCWVFLHKRCLWSVSEVDCSFSSPSPPSVVVYLCTDLCFRQQEKYSSPSPQFVPV